MSEVSEVGKSFGPKHLVDDLPSHSWKVGELGAYARQQHELIVESEKPVVAVYWRLGMALVLARKQFDHGEWEKYLGSLGIDKTRAAKARAIFQTFSGEQELFGRSVEEAYNQRMRRQSPKTRKTRRKKRRRQESGSVQRTVQAFLTRVSQDAEELFEAAGTVKPSAVNKICLGIERAIRGLEQLRERLHGQAEL